MKITCCKCFALCNVTEAPYVRACPSCAHKQVVLVPSKGRSEKQMWQCPECEWQWSADAPNVYWAKRNGILCNDCRMHLNKEWNELKYEINQQFLQEKVAKRDAVTRSTYIEELTNFATSIPNDTCMEIVEEIEEEMEKIREI